MDGSQRRKPPNPSPKLEANFISRLSFWWLGDLFCNGKRRHLQETDLYDVLPENVSEPLGDQLERSWKKELKDAGDEKRKASLWRAIIRTLGWPFVRYAFGMLLLNVVKILQPLILAMLISYFDTQSTMSTEEAYMYATGLVLATMMQTVILRQVHLGFMEIGMRVRIACSSLIYRKVLKLSSASAGQAAGGLIINLLSNDLSKFEHFSLFLHYGWVMIFVVSLITYLMYRQLGVAAFAGIALMTVQILPMQVCWYKLTKKLGAKGAVRTDKRVLLLGEILNGIRVIKMYTWEKSFEQLVFLARKIEIDALLKRFYVRSVRVASTLFTYQSAVFFTILVYVLQGHVIVADKIFSMIYYFALVKTIMGSFFPESVSLGAEVNVSMKRIENFLLMEEIEPDVKRPAVGNDGLVILMKNVSASWEKHATVDNLHAINVSVPLDKLWAIVGPVGSGKSTFLKLILNELQPYSGQVSVRGSVSYASQEPWLFTGSVRDNIVFGDVYDNEKYDRVTRACGLFKDFEQLPYGDKTLVGERGMALSGGQCARVSLARAVYRDADIYLFDDPLSAVDNHVGRGLFEDCINGLLKGKTRILVTHQVQYLKQVDNIILLNNGRIEFQGTFQDFYNNEQYLKYLPSKVDVEKLPSEESSIKNIEKVMPVFKSDRESDKEPRETAELLAKGRIPKSLYVKYFKSGASYYVLALLVMSFSLTQLAVSGFDYWIAYWIKQEEKRMISSLNVTSTTNLVNTDDFINQSTAISVYGGLLVAIIVLSITRNLLFYKIVLNASKNIHNRMFSRLVRAPLKFFNNNPTGRIINRFSKDTGTVDDDLITSLLDVMERIMWMTGIVIQILIVRWWSIFPMLGIAYLSVKGSDIYLSKMQEIKRLEGNAKSPVFSIVNTSMLGLLTIRACRAQKIVSQEFDARQDDHTVAHNLILAAAGAFGFWMDMISIGFLTFVVYAFIFLDNNQTFAGDVGLIIVHILNVCGLLQYTIKQITEVVTQFTSVERMVQFTKLEQEEPFETDPEFVLAKTWPDQGQIRFEKLYLRYCEEEEPVLKNLNLTIDPNSKVGIVGRTGAGKSSLISALFQLAKTDGSLLIDQVDTKKIGLIDLRSKISIIPQEPTLFTASLRDNLDPFHQYEDASLWSALEDVELNKMFDSLDHLIERGGNNLSAGQRQLLCLARAIVRKNRILVLDEATANVDPATDELIQRAIRLKFKDCTVLTIAHRLNTIMDSDKVLVMDDGVAVEFDQPHVLLQKNDGYFSKMVQQCGNAMSQHLKSIAEKIFDENMKNDSKNSVPNGDDNMISRLQM